MSSPLETKLTTIFKTVNQQAIAIVTSKNESKLTTNANTVFKTQRFYQVWYTTNPNNLTNPEMRATKVAEIKPHQVIIYTNRFDVVTQQQMLAALNQFSNQSLHDQLTALNIQKSYK